MTIALRPERQQEATGLGALGLLVLLVGPFLANLDLFITNVALPSIARDLAASPAQLELVAAGYGVAYALLLVPAGRLGDRFGRRRLLAVGLAAFTTTSLLAGLAPTAGLLIAARVLQGAAAALLAPQVLATVQTVLTGHARARAVGRYAVAGGLSAVTGQLVGGLLIQADVLGVGWRAVFLVNLPFGIAALLLLRRSVPETRSPAASGLDPLGVALLAVALVGLLLPLTEGPALGWPWWCVALLVAVVPAIAVLVAVERRAERAGRLPLLPPSLLRVPSMRRGLPVLVVFFTAVGAFLFGFALTTQEVLGLDPLQSGLAITPVTVVYVLVSFAVPGLLRRFGRGVLVAGGLLQGAAFAVLAALLVAGVHALPLVLPALALGGLGQALGVGAIFRIVLSGVPGHLAGVGGGVMVTAQQTALALGVAVLGSVFTALLPVDPLLAIGVLGAALVVTQVVTAAAAAALPRLPRLPER
ncbi:MFS transporter [Amnibacterium setariae]|uniref:MFS transporter n=1 Tax=Amnibacterium setariae TaxID=2306585 RepID=A0A3A1TUA3_9MICO|nr:MFS transporter [Amnibacterium setariae]RIX27823.1 MFS transporter [Amnibacterium setariae]